MSARVVADMLEFARLRKVVEGEFPLADLSRIQDLLASNTGTVAYQIVGDITEQGELALRCRVNCNVIMGCQRCLEPMDVTVASDSTLMLVTDAAKVQEDAPDEADRLLANEPLDIEALVEDEILLALPMAPRHPEGHCRQWIAPGASALPGPLASLAVLRPGKHD